MAASPRFRSRRSGRSSITRRSLARRRRNGFSTISPRFSVCCSRTPCARALGRHPHGTTPLPDPDPPLNELEAQGKVVFERACAQCHGGPAQSNGHFPIIRFHNIAEPVSASDRYASDRVVTPARFAFARVPAAARSQCPDLRDCSVCADAEPCRVLPPGPGSPDQLRSRSRVVDRVRWRPCAPRTIGTNSTCPALRGIRNTAPYFHNNSAATLEEVVDHYTEFFKRIQGEHRSRRSHRRRSLTTDGMNVDRQPYERRNARRSSRTCESCRPGYRRSGTSGET